MQIGRLLMLAIPDHELTSPDQAVLVFSQSQKRVNQVHFVRPCTLLLLQHV